MIIPDGIWIGLDHERHVADPALGGTDLKDILVSPVQWHGRKRNPVWRKILEGAAPKAAAARAANGRVFGSAFHCVALEPGEFDKRYVVAPPNPQWPASKQEIIDAIIHAGGKPLPLSAASIKHLATARLWGVKTADDWADELKVITAGREMITPEWHTALTTMRRLLEHHSQAMRFLSHGRAEVSMFWTDEHGDRYKVRWDYLRIRTLADLKTYALAEGRNAVESFNRNRSRFNYEGAAVYYMNARTEVLPGLVERGRIYRGNPEPDADGDMTAVPATDADRKFFEEVAAFDKPRWWWVAASTGGVPEVDTIEFRQDLMAWASAQFQVDQAKQSYRDFRAKFGPDDNELWADDRGLISLTDDHFGRTDLNRGSPLHDVVEG